MKKTIFTFLLTTGLFGLLVSCFCKAVAPYWNYTTVNINVLDGNYHPIVNNIVSTDRLILSTEMEIEYLSQSFSPPLFTNTCSATQKCDSPGHLGLKDPILSIKVISNNEFNGTPAGKSLNHIASIETMPIEDYLTTYYSVTEFQHVSPNLQIVLAGKPIGNPSHQFSLIFEHQSGTINTFQTDTITWN